jgi:CBS domain-containing protein
MYVKDVMRTEVISAPKGTPVQEAFETMRDGGFRHLPVLDEFGMVAGILSDRDLRSVGAIYKDEATGTEDFLVTEDTTVDKIMASKPFCLIVTKGGELLGILSYLDLLDALKKILDKPAQDSAA